MASNKLTIHWPALVVAVIIGSIYSSHHFFIPRFLDPAKEMYYPIAWAEYFDEALLYAPRAVTVFRDFRVTGDFAIFEHRTFSPSVLPLLPPLVMGGLGRVLGSVERGYAAADFLLPALIFLAVYALAREVLGRTGRSLVCASLFALFPKLAIYIPPVSSINMRELLSHAMPFEKAKSVLFFHFFDEPKLTFFFTAMALLLILRALLHGGRGKIVAAGVALGILFYTYLYDWSSTVVALFIMASFFWLQGNRRQVACIAGIGGVAVLVSSYYWLNMLWVRGLSTAHDIIARFGGEFSHRFRIGSVWKSYLRAAVLVALMGRTRAVLPVQFVFISSLLLSYFVVVNIQVITGWNPSPDHWYRTQFLPITLAVWVLLTWVYDRIAPVVIKRQARFVIALFLAYLLGGALYGQYTYSRDMAPFYVISRERTEIFEWLNANTPHDSAVGTLRFLANNDIQMHTHNKVFLPFGLMTVASEDELWHRMMIIARIHRLAEDQFAALFREGGGSYYLFMDQYGDHGFDDYFRAPDRRMPEDVIAKRTREYAAYLQQKQFLIPYRLDYLYVEKDPSHPPLQLAYGPDVSLTLLFENDAAEIYEVDMNR